MFVSQQYFTEGTSFFQPLSKIEPNSRGRVRVELSRTKHGDITTASYTQPSQTVLTLHGDITAPYYLMPRPDFPRVENIFASNRD